MVSTEDFLRSESISFVLHEHDPVYTCEELERFLIPGLSSKNLFLRDQKGQRFFLLILSVSRKSNIKKISELTGAGKLSFANADVLKAKLSVEAGAVSPFGLLNNREADVELLIDNEVALAPIVHFHPNRNTTSLELTSEMFNQYLGLLKNKITRIHST